MSIKSLLSAIALTVAAISSAQASVITITANQDATIGGGYNNAGNTAYRWVGDSNYFAIFGFDVSALVGKTITAVDFSAYHNYTGGDGTVGAYLGTNNTWNASTVVNYTGFGALLDTDLANQANMNMFETWNLGAMSVTGNRMTVALKNTAGGWNDYQPVTANAGKAAYIKVTVADVPEPASLGLFGLALAGLGLARRRKAA
jgi:hypothetical protein